MRAKKLFIQTFLKLKHNAIINLENTQITSWSTIVFSCVTEHFPTLIELSGSRTNKGRTIRKVKERGGGGVGEFLPCILFFLPNCYECIFFSLQELAWNSFSEFICYPYFTKVLFIGGL